MYCVNARGLKKAYFKTYRDAVNVYAYLSRFCGGVSINRVNGKKFYKDLYSGRG